MVQDYFFLYGSRTCINGSKVEVFPKKFFIHSRSRPTAAPVNIPIIPFFLTKKPFFSFFFSPLPFLFLFFLFSFFLLFSPLFSFFIDLINQIFYPLIIFRAMYRYFYIYWYFIGYYSITELYNIYIISYIGQIWLIREYRWNW